MLNYSVAELRVFSFGIHHILIAKSTYLQSSLEDTACFYQSSIDTLLYLSHDFLHEYTLVEFGLSLHDILSQSLTGGCAASPAVYLR